MKVIQMGPVPLICYDSTEVIGQTFVRVRDAFLRPCRNHRGHTVQNLPGLTLARPQCLLGPELLVNVHPKQVPADIAAFLMERGFGSEMLPSVCAIVDAKSPRHIQRNSRSNAVVPLRPRFLDGR